MIGGEMLVDNLYKVLRPQGVHDMPEVLVARRGVIAGLDVEVAVVFPADLHRITRSRLPTASLRFREVLRM